MDPVRRLLKTFRVARGIKVFRRLVVSVARGDVPDAAPQLKAQAQRIKRQKRKIERQERELERQKRHIEANNWQIEQLQKKLAEANSQLLRLSRKARRNGSSSEEVTKIEKI